MPFHDAAVMLMTSKCPRLGAAGVKRISGLIYGETRTRLRSFLSVSITGDWYQAHRCRESLSYHCCRLAAVAFRTCLGNNHCLRKSSASCTQDVIKMAVILAEHGRRHTVTTADIVRALKRRNMCALC